MLILVEYNAMPLAISLAIGFATGVWMYRGHPVAGKASSPDTTQDGPDGRTKP